MGCDNPPAILSSSVLPIGPFLSGSTACPRYCPSEIKNDDLIAGGGDLVGGTGNLAGAQNWPGGGGHKRIRFFSRPIAYVIQVETSVKQRRYLWLVDEGML